MIVQPLLSTFNFDQLQTVLISLVPHQSDSKLHITQNILFPYALEHQHVTLS